MLDKIIEFLPILLKGAVVTVEVTIYSLILGTILGLILALMRVSRFKPISFIAASFINIIRGLPIIVQLFYIYFVLPDIGIDLTAFQAGVIGLGIAYAAYHAENFRAGIEAVDRGQLEAAQSIGMKMPMIMRRVILPQALRIVLPPYGNTMIMMLKDSSLVSTITVMEMTRAGQMIAASTFENMTVYSMIAVMYLILSIPLILLARHFEKRYS